MASILDTIVSDTKAELARRRQRVSIESLEDRPLFKRETRPFASALRSDRPTIIAEIKKKSPSKGIIRADFDVPNLAKAYDGAGASAISVLTEPFHFDGNIEYLATAQATTTVPLLRKDFIVDPYQVVEAKAYGADAVLLIATILSRSQLAELQAACAQCGLGALVELYDATELDRVDVDSTPVIGVNNRDLRTFEVDLNHSVSVFAELPTSTIRVSESGIETARDIHHLFSSGADSVLVGETFMRSEHPGDLLGQWLAELDELETKIS